MRPPKPGTARFVLGSVLWAAVGGLVVSAALLDAAGPARPQREDDGSEARVVHILAERFFFVPSRIKMNSGEVVELRIRSADTNHGFRIRKAGINIVVPKRGKGEARVRFRAGKKGLYAFECSKACGAGHSMMRGAIVVK